ncbi:protein ALP1-like [Stegodyphus dumicola]|uniref:protein ALP1-like n=1 Tax=Stegodyphus dumicola TaxID=202533 RepID=UPI0015ABB40E|nr:protein ALP1-like [Stegodyphus dumicola]
MDTPTSNKHWEEIATDFYLKWNFPMCFGALDGKHIKIKPPPGSGSMYYNYKGDFSIVLLALVDANLKFIYVDVGTNGRISDGGVWDKSKLKSLVERDELFLPAPNTLPGTDVNVPYVIVADDAFPLTQYIMKPYPGRHLTKEKRIFNYRLSRARRIVENAFGILAARFRLFGTTILTSPQKAQYFVLAACCLHNLLRSKKETTNLYTPEHSLDAEDFENNCIRKGTWNESTSKFISLQRSARNGSQEAKDVRDRFCNYFNGIGSIPWQEAMCDLH